MIGSALVYLRFIWNPQVKQLCKQPLFLQKKASLKILVPTEYTKSVVDGSGLGVFEFMRVE